MTLVEFLLARITEDERDAEAAEMAAAATYKPGATYAVLRAFVPGHVLAQCEVRRRVVRLHSGYHECTYGGGEFGNFHGDCATVLLLATPYAAHPGYDPSWRVG